MYSGELAALDLFLKRPDIVPTFWVNPSHGLLFCNYLTAVCPFYLLSRIQTVQNSTFYQR